MRNKNFIILFVFAILSILAIPSRAGTPLWTFTPLTATTVSVSSGDTATVQYQVTNQSSRAHTLSMQNIKGVTQITGGGLCSNPFVLSGHGSCTLSLQINGSQAESGNTVGPIVCTQGNPLQCYRPSLADTLNIRVIASESAVLSASLSNLALAGSGNARTITITNTGSATAQNVSINYPVWPPGTSANSTCGTTLAPGATCTITVTPGSSATSYCDSAYTAPTPGIITVSASNATSSTTTNVLVLNYGCIYEGGYLFSIDDTTANNTSIGGTVASLTNNSSGIHWYNGSNVTTNATSLTNGITNTATIISVQGTGNYAAEVCANYSIDSSGNSPCLAGTCYSNWYLPAICQMAAPGGSCVAGTPNILTNLSQLVNGCTGSKCLSGLFWSSTEASSSLADLESFSSGSSSSGNDSKSDSSVSVRCARALN